MFKRFKYIKNFKKMGIAYRTIILGDLIRGILWLGLGIGLYIGLKDTGLLVYIILMLKYHWMIEEEA